MKSLKQLHNKKMAAATPISEPQSAESLFFQTSTIGEYRTFTTLNKARSEDQYFLVTLPHESLLNWTETSIKVTDFTEVVNHSNMTQINVLSIASKMFADSRPLEGKELDVLKKTFEQSLSSTPTTLRKK